MSLRIKSLPYFSDSAQLFEQIAQEPWAIFLDSGFPSIQQGRYDFISAWPCAHLISTDDTIELVRQDGSSSITDKDIFQLAQSLLDELPSSVSEFPFSSGLMGYMSYDLGLSLESITSQHQTDQQMPKVALGLYDWVLLIDHQLKKTHLIAEKDSSVYQQYWSTLIHSFSQPITKEGLSFQVLSETQSLLERESYTQAFKKIHDYLESGDCYQINLARCFELSATGDAWVVYKLLRKYNPAPFSVYMNLPEGQVMSSSPERFLKVTHRQVETKPIKGTIKRSLDAVKDQQAQQVLRHSEKDRAENVMIVDLLRHDLSKSCALGSVKVDELFAVESFAQVHHLVSTIRGELAPDKTSLDLLKGCFPGGSITGAPKHRAMQIIDELEPIGRGLYCGSMGYMDKNGNMDMNIAIRTMTFQQETLTFYAGGGIVIDSVEAAEFEETMSKAQALFDVITQLKHTTPC